MPARTFNKRATKERRRELRKQMTPQERKLWFRLRNKQVDGLRFRTQTGVDYYIADFFCFNPLLAIEIDGRQHETIIGRGNDVVRDASFESLGIKVLRFTNEEIENDIESVIGMIRAVAKQLRNNLSSSPK